MTQELVLGTISGKKGAPFQLPLDLIHRKNAIIGMSGCGKTCSVAKMEEEYLRVGLPFSVLDTVGVHLGLRARKDGTPSRLPVVVFGGKRGDLPIDDAEIGFGARLAEIVLSSNFSIVIDLSKTYEEVRFRIAGEFCRALMNTESYEGRHIIVEETPEFMPETIEFKGQDKCRSEMTRLVTLGRNNGYTVTLVGQRWATIRKTALAQIENFFIMRTTASDDRKRLREIFTQIAPDADVSECFNSMAKLEDGEAWFFSPQWLNGRFERMKFSERDTFHPGETRKVGVKLTQVDMGDVQKFVSILSKQLAKTMVPVPAPDLNRLKRPSAQVGRRAAQQVIRTIASRPIDTRPLDRALSKANKDLQAENDRLAEKLEKIQTENARLQSELKNTAWKLKDSATKTATVREALTPLHNALTVLFRETEETFKNGAEGAVDAGDYADFFASAGKYGAKRLLEVMISRKRVKKSQLRTLARIRHSSYSTARAWMLRNKLMREEGDEWVLEPV